MSLTTTDNLENAGTSAQGLIQAVTDISQEVSIAVAEALNWGDGYEGGVFLFIAAQHQESMAQIVEAQGFRVGVWNNGSPTI